MNHGFLFAAPPAWWSKAKCRDVEAPRVAEFFGHSVEKAIRTCSSCSVQGDCLTAGIDEPVGVWGGADPRTRRQIRQIMAAEQCSPLDALQRLET